MISAIIRYLLFIVLNIVANLVGIFLNPIVVLFVNKSGYLPKCLRWFETPDNSLDGDNGWKTEHVLWLKNGSYLKRVLWLYRNNVHGFSTNVLGFIIEEGFRYEISGSEKVSNRPLYNGIVLRKIINPNGRVYFQWYWVKAWSKTKCIRVNLGWKLWNPRAGKMAQYVFSPAIAMGHS